MNIRELQRISAERCEAPSGFNSAISSWTILEWAGAMCGEAGEAANVAKKIRRDGPFYGRELVQMRTALAHELADVVCYAVLVAERMGIDLQDAIREKFNEVSDRRGCDIKL